MGTQTTHRRIEMAEFFADIRPLTQTKPTIRFVETIDDEWYRWELSGFRVGSNAPWTLTFDTEIEGRDLAVESAVGLSEDESKELLLEIHTLVEFPGVPE